MVFLFLSLQVADVEDPTDSIYNEGYRTRDTGLIFDPVEGSFKC